MAYPYANSGATSLYEAAKKIAPPSPTSGQPPGAFQPINPGNLINCLPPPCLSPLGPIAYLQEMLNVTPDTACANLHTSDQQPVKSPTFCANLETPLPLIDLVNENLENLVVTAPTTINGVVYNTAADQMGDHRLCRGDDSSSLAFDSMPDGCHDPEALFAAIPQYSTPAVPVQQPTAYDKLKTDFSAPGLPYSQSLDISRSYQQLLCCCRFDTMRAFRRCISEFVLDSSFQPPNFQAHLWRYPVRIELAIEYLGLTPEEYALLFAEQNCRETWRLYGLDSESTTNRDWTSLVGVLSQFLQRTGLSYCEFLELQRSGFIPITHAGSDKGAFPDCPPCCPDQVFIRFGENPDQVSTALCQLAVFIRLWRKLQESCIEGLSFTQLADIIIVLGPLSGGLNGEFIRQLAALLMLRDHFGLPLADEADPQPGKSGADRTHLLALWAGPSAGKWSWAVKRLLDRVEDRAKHHYEGCYRPERAKIRAIDLDPLSELCGFNPNINTDTWHARPSSTLRFAEVLAKIAASHFDVDDLSFLFTAQAQPEDDVPLPLQEPNEAAEFPLGKLGCEHPHSLWTLQEKLLAVELCEEDDWTWPRIVDAMHEAFAYTSPTGVDPLVSIGQHFFPHILEAHGQPVSAQQRQYRVTLAGSSATDWNNPPSGPFQYDDHPINALWTQIPLRDEAVIAKLGQMRQLTPSEQQAVQDLYFLPRSDLAVMAFIFPDFASAERFLIQEPDEHERWRYFRKHFALAHKRCRLIARHLAAHAAHCTGYEHEDNERIAWQVLKNLYADENQATTPWEADTGKVPKVLWSPQPNGGAFQALLGLMGTGLLGEFSLNGQQPIWREPSGRLDEFGHARNRWNSPLPTILPALDLTLNPAPARTLQLRNGYLSQTSDGELLGGAEGFTVTWSGVILIEHEGDYRFQAGHYDHHEHDCERPHHRAKEEQQ